MAHSVRVLPAMALTVAAVLSVACLPGGGGGEEPTVAPTSQANIQSVRTIVVTATPSPAPTQLPVLPVLTTYVVQAGDYPTLIAENAGVPAEEQDAWIAEMLALNGADAHSLQIGQKLILPPYGNGTLPTVRATEPGGGAGSPPAAVVEPAPPEPPAATPTPSLYAVGGIPMAPTPPFVAFTSPTATSTTTPLPTSTPFPTPTVTPAPTATAAPGERAWLTSSEETAQYYYCDLDTGWQSIPAEKLLVFDSEQKLLGVWGRFRVKAPDSVC